MPILLRPSRLALLFLGVVLFLVLFPHLGFAAATAPDTPVALNTNADTSFNLSPVAVVAIMSVLIPIVNGIATKLSDSSKLKAAITAGLSGVSGLITVGFTENGGSIISKEALFAAGITFVIANATYSGFYVPLELTSSMVKKTAADGTVTTKPGLLANVGRK